jgi:hypothetical protein
LPPPSEPRGFEAAVDVVAGELGFGWAADRLKTEEVVVVVVGASAG